jgi:hypothetical protein
VSVGRLPNWDSLTPVAPLSSGVWVKPVPMEPQAATDHAVLRGLQVTEVDQGLQCRAGLCAEYVDNRRQVCPKKVANSGVQSSKPPSASSGPKSWKCPTLKRIDVNKARTALVHHQNRWGERCAGSGYPLPQKSVDALNYRVAGNFEGGRR